MIRHKKAVIAIAAALVLFGIGTASAGPITTFLEIIFTPTELGCAAIHGC